jgi:hypothetical protein
MARGPVRQIVAALALGTVSLASASGPRFFDDDPLAREPETADASGAAPGDVGLFYDLSYNLFATSRRQPSNIHARNVNTIDEVPDSSWFTNRILPRRVALEEIVRGPNVGPPPDPSQWVLVNEKRSGFSPGFTARDARGDTWFLSFDPPGSSEGATAAAVVATKLFWTLGFNQIESFITIVDPRKLTIDPGARMRRPNGSRTPFTQHDLDAVFERSARHPDGTYRAVAGRLLPGTILGPFRYEGTRPDDPNDIIDHEHRRELRALRVFGAWTNLTDLKAGNTLDTLLVENGRSVVRHYLQDVGSTFGMGANGPHDWDEGFEYYYDAGASRRRLFSLGLALSPWQTARYETYPSVGRFESEAFDPTTWKPHAPTAAYMEMLPDDAFWAARRVAAFDDELIRAAVRTGQFSDPAAEAYLGAVLGRRRDRIARTYLTAVNPLVNPRLSPDGHLTFDDAAVAAGVGDAPASYRVMWSRFDNETGVAKPLSETRGAAGVLRTGDLPTAAGTFVQIDVSAEAGGAPGWRNPIHLHFRRTVEGWTLVGLDRGIGRAASAGSRAAERPPR